MRNRLIVLAAALVFAASVASVAWVAGGGDGAAALEKLPTGAPGAADSGRQAALSSEATEASSVAPVGFEYRLDGPLPDLAATAPAYRLPASVTRAEVARLAKALGLDGEVVEQPERFLVRAGTRELTVERQPGLPWNFGFSVSCPDIEASAGVMSSDVKCVQALPPQAVDVAVAVPDSAVGGIATGGGIVCPEPKPGAVAACPAPAPAQVPPPPLAPAPVPSGVPSPRLAPAPACPPDVADCKGFEPFPPPRPPDLPSRAAAEAQARALFTAIDAGLDSFEVTDGFDSWYASVQPRVGGLTVGWATTVAIGPRGEIQWASGLLAVPERIGDYPLVGTAAGFERLKSQGTIGGWFGYAPSERVPLGAPVPALGEPGTLSVEGGPVRPVLPPGELIVQTVTGVHLGLQFLGDRLVPVYVFEFSDGGTAEVPAVIDELLESQELLGKVGIADR
ncbi:MAG: hypothetical protein ACRD1K_02850 [Acidimicrobiales bacterium]